MVNLINIAHLLSQPLVVHPDTLTSIMAYLDQRASGEAKSSSLEGQDVAEGCKISELNGVGIMQISGVLTPRMSLGASCGEFVSTTAAHEQFLALSQRYSEILLIIDSPGGAITGVPEFAESIRNSTAKVTGFTNSVAASGGYWLLSACHEVVATPSASLGNIGAYIALTKNKQENRYEAVHYFSAGAKKLYGARDIELTDAEASHFQSSVDGAYEWFTSSVATYRGKSVEEIKATEAGTYDGRDAVGLLVDRVVNNIMEV